MAVTGSAELAEDDNEEMRELVDQLEQEYDDRTAQTLGGLPDLAQDDEPSLAPDVERFLQDLNTSLDAD